jgi:hypothetical protein
MKGLARIDDVDRAVNFELFEFALREFKIPRRVQRRAIALD